MPPMGKDMLKDKGNRKPSASTGHETSDTEDPSGRGNMPGQMRHRDHVDGAMPQPPARGSNASTVKTPGHSPKVGKEQEGGDGVDNENSKSRILDKISSFTYDQWVIGGLVVLCFAYLFSEIQTLKYSNKMFTALDESRGNINEKTKYLTKELVSLKESIANSNTDMQVKAEEMRLKLEKADTELEKFQDRMINMTKKITKHDKDLDTAFSNLFNKEAAIIVIVLILTMNIGLVCAVYVLCKGRNRTGGASANATNRNVNGDTYYNPVLNRVPRESVLRKAVGVISFSQQHQHLHRRLVESLKDGIRGPIDVVYHVILRDEDIVNIPRCSLIIICIEYSARDVIIERSGFGLGDFNKTTLQAVQQLGAIPVIVYDYDNRSQRLGENEIFSQQIGCATRQEELIPLSRANRFYSVYDSFSAHQKQVLQEIIQAHVLNLARF